MTFSNPRGTYGARQPHGAVMRWMNKMMAKRAGKSGKMMGMQVLALTTTGRKSGAERSTPVAWFPGPGDTRYIVASAAGAANNPAWYHNIAAHPDQVSIEVGGQKIHVHAEELQSPERERVWAEVVAASSRFGGYETKTDRTIPILALTPRG